MLLGHRNCGRLAAHVKRLEGPLLGAAELAPVKGRQPRRLPAPERSAWRRPCWMCADFMVDRGRGRGLWVSQLYWVGKFNGVLHCSGPAWMRRPARWL